MLSTRHGERFLTDLRHVAQLLHAAVMADGLGSTALTAWLRHRISEADQDAGEDRSRRLESDAEAVQVLTIHRSKGLEFPVVYCPYMWEGYSRKAAVPVFHDTVHDNLRTVDVSREGAAFVRNQWLALVEQRGEDLRLLYVALTRAKHQAVLWWAGAFEAEQSPLGRLLFAGGENGVVNAFAKSEVSDEQVAAQLTERGGGISVERIGPVSAAPWEGGSPPPPELEADLFHRTLDLSWRRASYSSITRASHAQSVGSEPEQDVVSDEDVSDALVADTAVASSDASWSELPLLLADMPGGTRVGTLVHSVLEATDFTAADLPGELLAALKAELSWQHLDLGDLGTVVKGLCTAVESPLGPSVGGCRLRDLDRRDRLDELTFELPLVGGDDPRGALSVMDIAQVLEARLHAGDPVAGYASRLAESGARHDLPRVPDREPRSRLPPVR